MSTRKSAKIGRFRAFGKNLTRGRWTRKKPAAKLAIIADEGGEVGPGAVGRGWLSMVLAETADEIAAGSWNLRERQEFARQSIVDHAGSIVPASPSPTFPAGESCPCAIGAPIPHPK
jgi:hypothetical protein